MRWGNKTLNFALYTLKDEYFSEISNSNHIEYQTSKMFFNLIGLTWSALEQFSPGQLPPV